MRQYHGLMIDILKNGIKKEDRTGTGTLSVFGRQMRFNLADGFPLVTTKKMFLRGIIEELNWFLKGETNIQPLLEKNVNIWNKDAYRFYKEREKKEEELNFEDFISKVKEDYTFAQKWGDLGPVYGKQWRSWTFHDEFQDVYVYYEKGTIDQISEVIEQIKTNPDSRRLIVSAWNPGELKNMALPPCHILFQFYVADGKLSCQLYQRSADVFLGVPFNIASYALLTMMIAQQTGLEPGEFIHTIGDAHIYLNHIEQVELQLTREPKSLPKMKIKKAIDIFSYKYEDFTLENYDSYPSIKGDMST